MRLNNIRLLVSDFDKSFLFYRDVIGFKVTWGNTGEYYAQFATGTCDLAIFSKNLMADVVGTSHLSPKVISQDSIALIFSVNDVDELYKILSAKGIEFVTKPTDQPDWGIRVAHMRDPEGNLLEFSSDLPKEKYSESLKQDFELHSN
jgi:lactoylglutathione lyase